MNVKLPLDLTPITEGLRSISETMRAIRDSVALLPQVAETLAEIQDGVKFEDLSLAIHPLRRATGKLGRRRAANGDAGSDEDQTSSGENVSQAAGSADA